MRGFALLACLAGCDPPLDLGDTEVADLAARDAGRVRDSESRDSEPRDSEPWDSGPVRDSESGSLGSKDSHPRDAEAGDAADTVEGPPLYPPDRLVSPLTPHQVQRLRAVLAQGPAREDRVFAKVGASATASNRFLHCFSGPDVDLGGRGALAATIAWFRAGVPDPFARVSLAAVPGRTAGWALAGDPSPVDQELSALNPRFALVMFGTNDLQLRDLDAYAGHMLSLADHLLAAGVIPIFSSIMPRDDDPEADGRVPEYNAVIRGVAQGRQVPFVDLHAALVALPDHGVGADGIHPSTGGAGACDFTDDGLTAGYNWRNFLTISALHSLVESVLGASPAPDRPAPLRPESGGPADPIPIPHLPYAHLGDTARSPHRALVSYPGCNAPQDEGGPEVAYRLDLDRPQVVRARVLDRGDVDVDLHLLTDPRDSGTCLQRAHRALDASLGAGTWYFVLDTFVSGGAEHAGEYLFVLIAEDP